MVLAIGSDHGGFELKQELIKHLEKKGIEYKDFGCYNTDSIDYPLVAKEVATAIANGEYERGVLVCGTGVGISIAANKVKGIRAACCDDHFSVKYTRLHNDANILCLGGRVVGPGVACELIDLFVETEFEGGRHARRVGLIHEIEQEG